MIRRSFLKSLPLIGVLFKGSEPEPVVDREWETVNDATVRKGHAAFVEENNAAFEKVFLFAVDYRPFSTPEIPDSSMRL